MTVNMIFDKTRYLALMPANKISHNNGMAQLPLAISGKPFTTMKKALFHGRLRVFLAVVVTVLPPYVAYLQRKAAIYGVLF